MLVGHLLGQFFKTDKNNLIFFQISLTHPQNIQYLEALIRPLLPDFQSNKLSCRDVQDQNDG